MSMQIFINNNSDPKSDYITWSPTPCRIISDENVQKQVILSNKNPNRGGQIVFSNNLMSRGTDTLPLTIPPNGAVDFFIAGKFDLQSSKGFASENDKDAIISITDTLTNTNLGEKALMVRVRKDANFLTAGERDRFLDAIVKLNQDGAYFEMQSMHRADNNQEIHRRSCFLPWHRAFLLDLERKLQEINPAITIPYWKFDEPAPNVFNRSFMGIPLGGLVDFTNANPLINWRVQIFGVGSGMRIRRNYLSSSTAANPANNRAIRVQNNELQTLNRGNVFSIFATPSIAIENDPHGMAHVSFDGQVSNIAEAPADPLFFLLHCNIDRLWAKWQWIKENDLFRPNNPNAYPRQGNGNVATNNEQGIGNFTNDTMWSWNRLFGNSRPPRNPPPGTEMPDSPLTNFPGRQPTVGSMIDYQGQFSLANNLHFAYDDVPFVFQ
jgi:tyrosinase